MYRPEGFPMFSDDYVPPMPESFNTIFNWGADAMLGALCTDNNRLDCIDQYGVEPSKNVKGWLVFIPEEAE